MQVHPLVAALVDDAGLFPPERLPMDRALARHRADAAGGHPVLTHRFLCAGSRLGELRAHLRRGDTLRLGLIVDAGPAAVVGAVSRVHQDPRLTLETVEVALPATDPVTVSRAHAATLATSAPAVFVEVPRAPGWQDALDVLAAAGVGAKLRCGGVRVELFPTRAELAAMIAAIVQRGLSWKATAGLHHAVRHRDPRTGFTHHGFLNLLVAVGQAVRGGTPDELAATLAVDDGPTLVTAVRGMDRGTVADIRSSLTAYGSCSTSQPVADLDALGLLDDGTI